MLDVHPARDDVGDLVELRHLPGLDPATLRSHAGDADNVVAGAGVTDELGDLLRRLAGSRDDRGHGEKLRHRGFFYHDSLRKSNHQPEPFGRFVLWPAVRAG